MGNSCQPCSESILNCSKAIINVDSLQTKDEVKRDFDLTNNTNLTSGSFSKKKSASFCYEKNKNENFKTRKINSFKLTDLSLEFLTKALKKTVVFSQVPNEELPLLMRIMYKIECKIGQEIVNLSNPIVFFFVIKIGKFIIQDYDQEESRELVANGIYGENSLFQVEKLNGSIECVEDAEIYALNRKDYQGYIKERNTARLKEKLYLLNNCELFSKSTNLS